MILKNLVFKTKNSLQNVFGVSWYQWRRQDFSLEAYRGAEGVGCGNFDYLILKWRILMHISGILTYLF